MWKETKDGFYKSFDFKDFKSALEFIVRLGEVAEQMNHHPTLKNTYNKVEIWLLTHDLGGKITQLDKEMSKKIDQIISEPIEVKKIDSMVADAILFADGGSRGNPGPSASGFVIYDSHDNELAKGGEYLGITTNNQAEYQALKLGIETAQQLGIRELQVYMDSLLVINQMKGAFKVKNRDLWPIHQAIKELLGHFKKVHFEHVPREHNKVADSEVNRVLDTN
ncbi:MAG: reverse transcriptase-like protein [Patescibacteria group bacterium]